LRIEELEIEKADANFVYEKIGFPIGGVPAFCHKTPIKYVFIDQDLIKFEKVWSAAGTPHAIFEIPTKDLIELSGAKTADIKLTNNL
jgi:prolyl-tRNA editing enzyme YbaK/EbsC (Cys-tRNA(Pro) deacylase)